MIVKLTPGLAAYADWVAAKRAGQNRSHFNPIRIGSSQKAMDVLGARSEAAVLQLFTPSLRRRGFNPIDCWKSYIADVDPSTIRGDVASWEVRARRDTRWTDLIIYEADDDSSRFIQTLRRRDDEFEILGWSYAAAAKHESWLLKPPKVHIAAYFMPREWLRPIPQEWLS